LEALMARPIAGIGIGLRRAHLAALQQTRRRIDFVELTPENWVCFGGWRRRDLDACLDRFPATAHSVSLSIGGGDPLDPQLLDAIAALNQRLEAPWWSDHLCYSTALGQRLNDLLPLPFTAEVVAHTATRVAAAIAQVGQPLLLENATYYAQMPGAQMDEAAFLCATLEAADCGMLLDVNNVYVNSQNHGFDPYSFIDRLPLDRVRYLHLAGHSRDAGLLIDTHIGPIIDPVWALYRHTLARAGRLIPTLIEWDQDLPPLDVLLDEVDRARALAAATLGASSGAE
jgi:uncharacterized protein (UPF0276 family)